MRNTSADPLAIPLQEWARGGVESDEAVGAGEGRSRSTSTSLHLAAIFAGKAADDKLPPPPQLVDRQGAWEQQYECELHYEYDFTIKGSMRGFRSDRNAWIQLGYAARADGRED